MTSEKLLSICIPTVMGREASLQKLLDNLINQINDNNCSHLVEIIVDQDNKEVSIGAKRNRMYDKCNGLFSVQIDDDDNVVPDYIETIMLNMDKRMDCIGYQEHCVFDNRRQGLSDISVKHDKWAEYTTPVNGFNHVRSPFFKVPIKTTICQFLGVKDMRWGEDHDFADRARKYIRTETYIDKVMYLYKYTSEEHNKKYGITK